MTGQLCFIFIYYEAYQHKENALKREKFLKTTKGKMQLRKQIALDN